MRKPKACAAAVVSGPSADGNPAPTVTRIGLSSGSGSTGRTTIHRPSTVCLTRSITPSSATTSAVSATRRETAAPPAVAAMCARAAAGSTRWSKARKMSGWRSVVSSSAGAWATRVGGGVRKVHVWAACSVDPAVDAIPAGTVARYSVAIGNRPPSGSKITVCEPAQRHWPAGWGSRSTGTPAAARAACDVRGTIGWLNVTARRGAVCTSPSGW